MRSLCDESVHLFYTRVDSIGIGGSLHARCRDVLSREETAKAQRFRNSQGQHLSLVSRAMLRYLLSEYTGSLAKAIQFKTNQHGKPFRVKESACGGPDIQFNLSHCKGAVLCGLCLGKDIGVDLENTDRWVNPAMAARFFSSTETARIMNGASEDDRATAFLDTWTLKEAYIKAKGKGLSIPLDSFSFDRLYPTVEISFKNGADRPGDWQFFRWQPEPGKIASVAIRSKHVMAVKTFYCTPFKEIIFQDRMKTG
ncbi:MAG: phosphopantetheinyl transferase [Desulfobacterales bacterium]|nr:MAG: phosphopantetheinyl transferase [Desulfobacterales bacterium]